MKPKGELDWERLQGHARRNGLVFWLIVGVLAFIACAYVVGLLQTAFGIIAFAAGVLTQSTADALDANTYTAFAGLFSILALAATAGLTVFGYRMIRLAQIRQKTLEFIEKTNEDQDIFGLFERLRYIRAKYKDDICFDEVYGEFLAARGGDEPVPPDAEERLDYDYIVHLLNFYETWSIGILYGALDEQMLCEFWRVPLILHWTQLVAFVLDYREKRQNGEAYINAEALALHWADKSEREAIEVRAARWKSARSPQPAPPRNVFGLFTKKAA